jgi:hypothetical protein
MAKQLLIYDKAQPVSKTKPGNWSVKSGNNFSFAKEINSVPVTAVEFPNAAQEYAIVFAGEGESIVSVAIMGVRERENLYIGEDGKISTKYVPAFLRRYPFVFSSSDDGANFTLCIDESFEGCNQGNIGERLFDGEGEQTLYLKRVLEFLKEYQAHFIRTKAFCKKLKELDLLEPMSAQFKVVDGSMFTLSGFMAVNREKLKNLTSEQISSLIKTDELELIYIHLQSLRNFNLMLDKVSKEEKVSV